MTPEKLSSAEQLAAGFEALVHDKAAVMVNFYAPWCFWSNKLAPTWGALAFRAIGASAHREALAFATAASSAFATTRRASPHLRPARWGCAPDPSSPPAPWTTSR